MKIKAYIERGNDGFYSIYIKENLGFGLIGTGKSVNEAKEDFMISIDEMREMYEEENKAFPSLEVEFLYDTASFLQYYNQFITLAGMQRLTGINQAQLSHYIQGVRNPSPKTAEKIQKSIHEFGKELQHLEFA